MPAVGVARHTHTHNGRANISTAVVPFRGENLQNNYATGGGRGSNLSWHATCHVRHESASNKCIGLEQRSLNNWIFNVCLMFHSSLDTPSYSSLSPYFSKWTPLRVNRYSLLLPHLPPGGKYACVFRSERDKPKGGKLNDLVKRE